MLIRTTMFIIEGRSFIAKNPQQAVRPLQGRMNVKEGGTFRCICQLHITAMLHISLPSDTRNRGKTLTGFQPLNAVDIGMPGLARILQSTNKLEFPSALNRRPRKT
ncbi:hypothetical protein ElyMa_003705500 [Elysia marginata]|uniref:Uncharacterized protein n=1 Tax=Elysia marginata TaxID=1093978 RepID=A0AAV4F3U8_9GAST|nr:hypothetical protein ElyMa_003705500 [Elysia marginata]